jgi:hypothetical protein
MAPSAPMSVPIPLAVLSWFTAGLFLLGAAGFGTSALQNISDQWPPGLAAIAAGLLLLATYLIVITAASLRRSDAAGPSRLTLGVVAVAGFLVAAYIFFAAAPGGPSFRDSWTELIAAAGGLWLGVTALAAAGERVCWRVVAVACLVLLVASVAVTTGEGQ